MYRFAVSFIERIRAAHTATLALVAAGKLPHFVPKPEPEKPKYTPRAEKLGAICRMDWGDTHGDKIRTLLELVIGEPIPEVRLPKDKTITGTPVVNDETVPVFSVVFPLAGKNQSSHAYQNDKPICRFSVAGYGDTFTDAAGTDGPGGHISYTGEIRLATKEETETFLAELAAAKIPDRKASAQARLFGIFEPIAEAVAPAK
jgi:hypothetical protein